MKSAVVNGNRRVEVLPETQDTARQERGNISHGILIAKSKFELAVFF